MSKESVQLFYTMEVHRPEGHDDLPVLSLESQSPFGAIHRGDLVHWDSGLGRVIEVQHLIVDEGRGKVQHKLIVYTESADRWDFTKKIAAK